MSNRRNTSEHLAFKQMRKAVRRIEEISNRPYIPAPDEKLPISEQDGEVIVVKLPPAEPASSE